MPIKVHTELAFKEAIENVLLQSGCIKGNTTDYNKDFN